MSTEVSRSHDLSERLVRHAAGKAPPALRERLEEEWLADLQSRPGLSSRLRFALGCEWAGRVIAVEHPGLVLAGAGQGRVGQTLFAPAASGDRRAGNLVLVVGLHAALFYAAWSSLTLVHKHKVPDDLVNTPIPQPTVEKYRPRPDVNLNPVIVHVPVPETAPVAKKPEPETERVVTGGREDGVGPDLTPQVELARTPHRVPGAPAAGFPNVDDYYPAGSIRNGETGVTAVQVCVNPRGRLESDPTTVRSSGSAALDAAALRLAKAGSGHYRPATEDGLPVTSCFAYAVRFHIR